MNNLNLIEENKNINSFNSIIEIIEDLKQGKMVVIVDDESRENEGDLVMLADKVTDESINFMAQYGRGLICLSLPKDQCLKLGLAPMTSKNKAKYSTNFTVSIEAAIGVTTGISAKDRATTIHAAIKKNASSHDVVSPGHIFPIIAKLGGVLTRAGHTEASSDLARLAGSDVSAAVIVEILNQDGSMARRNDLEKFAKEHKLKMATIDSLIKYRLVNEKTIRQELKQNYQSRFGEFTLYCFRETISDNLHYALVKGNIDKNKITDVRVHVANHMQDLLFVDNNKSGWTLDRAMQHISQVECGVVVIINSQEENEHNYENTLSNLKSYLGSKFASNKDLDSSCSRKVRQVGVGSQILSSLGVNKMRLLSNQQKYTGLSGFSLNIVDYLEYK
tara:strand:- start:13233 stop:14402 length:1170 start_codon:yes stop_codon:yes gene_type:complete